MFAIQLYNVQDVFSSLEKRRMHTMGERIHRAYGFIKRNYVLRLNFRQAHQMFKDKGTTYTTKIKKEMCTFCAFPASYYTFLYHSQNGCPEHLFNKTELLNYFDLI